ncbi:MAG: Gfo/Idh/MocA family oxidoreductase [Kiritimatiellae bacterium]|nr:Gfo/Idh/MocA family oxidoreductase [Kiritimatiellia bacterium]
MNNKSKSVSRRTFIKGAGVATASISAPLILTSGCLSKRFAPSHKITLGFIGMGSQGNSRNLGTFLNQDDAKVLAVCDCRLSAALEAKEIVDKRYGNSDCAVYQDFREIINRPDIDAVVISTPDHWHVPMSMMALRAGKDVFCEKPSLYIKEGMELVDEVKKRNAIFQWGIEDRSLIKYHRLAGWVRNGAIGELKTIHVRLPGKEPFLLDKPAPVPDDLDWNLWLGPAPLQPYTPSITGRFNWRLNADFGGGMLTDWGAHLIDTAQVANGMEASGPVEVFGKKRKLDPKIYQTNAPVDFKLHYRYANGVEMFVDDGEEVDLKFVGTKGWVRCEGWDGIWTASDPSILRIKDFGRKMWTLPPIEHRDFLNSMRSRKPPAYFAEAGHRLSTTLHLGHIAIRSGRTIRWDPKAQFFADGDTESAKSIVYDRPARDWERA